MDDWTSIAEWFAMICSHLRNAWRGRLRYYQGEFSGRQRLAWTDGTLLRELAAQGHRRKKLSMNTIAPRLAPLSATPSTTPRAATTEQPATQVDQVTLRKGTIADGPAPTAQDDQNWGKLARATAITAGVVGGIVVAGAAAQAVAMGGMGLGNFVVGQMYQEALPRAIGLSYLLHASNSVMLATPLIGAVAGGVIGGIASCKKDAPAPSDIPGSGLDQKARQQKIGIGGLPRWTWSAVKTSMRDAANDVHDSVNGVAHAQTFKDAVKSGASAGFAFGDRVGSASGGIMGLVQGACIGAMYAGMPFSFAPWTAVPVAIVSAWGLSHVMSQVGGVPAGSVVGAGGAVVGAAAYGVKQVAHAVHSSGNQQQPAPQPYRQARPNPAPRGPWRSVLKRSNAP